MRTIIPVSLEPFQPPPQPPPKPNSDVSKGPIVAPNIKSVSGLYDPYAANSSRHPLRMEIAPAPPKPLTHDMVIQNPEFRSNSVKAFCTGCRYLSFTIISYRKGILYWIAIIFCFLLVLPGLIICLLQFDMKPLFGDVVHNCSKCHSYFGTYRRLC